MTDEIPLWVREEALRRVKAESAASFSGWVLSDIPERFGGNGYSPRDALCRLIMETMPEPVDLIEAEAERLAGEWRHTGRSTEMLAIAALKRGMELAGDRK